MRIIVEAFKDALELGLAKHRQIVARLVAVYALAGKLISMAAHDSHIRIWLANRKGDRQLSCSRFGYVSRCLWSFESALTTAV